MIIRQKIPGDLRGHRHTRTGAGCSLTHTRRRRRRRRIPHKTALFYYYFPPSSLDIGYVVLSGGGDGAAVPRQETLCQPKMGKVSHKPPIFFCSRNLILARRAEQSERSN